MAMCSNRYFLIKPKLGVRYSIEHLGHTIKDLFSELPIIVEFLSIMGRPVLLTKEYMTKLNTVEGNVKDICKEYASRGCELPAISTTTEGLISLQFNNRPPSDLIGRIRSIEGAKLVRLTSYEKLE